MSKSYENMSKEELISLLIKKDANIGYLNVELQKGQKKIKKLYIKLFMQNLQMLALFKEIQRKKETIQKQKFEKYGNKSLDRSNYLKETSDGSYTAISSDETVANDVEMQTVKKKRGRKHKENGYYFDKSIPAKTILLGIKQTCCECCGKPIVNKDIKTREYLKLNLTSNFNPLLEKINAQRYTCKNCGHTINEPKINAFDNQSFATPSLVATLCYAKYGYAMTTYRLEDMLTKIGVKLPRQIICKYLMNLSTLLQPIYLKLKENVINNSAKVLHIDETPFSCIIDRDDEKSDNDVKRKRKTNYIWLMSTTLYDSPIYYYHYNKTRSFSCAEELLSGYNGYIMCDDFSAYEKLDKENKDIKKVGCLFHAKKKYGDIVQQLNSKNIDLKNSETYKIEMMLSNIFHQENKFMKSKKTPNYEEVKVFRNTTIKPLLDNYYKYIEMVYKKVDKECQLGKAINYSIANKKYFYRIFEDGRIPLSNIRAEQGIRPFTILRKNALFAYNKNGASATAILMSIVQTCESNLIRPDLYIEYVLNSLVKGNVNIDDLLPTSTKLPKKIYFNKINSHNFL